MYVCGRTHIFDDGALCVCTQPFGQVPCPCVIVAYLHSLAAEFNDAATISTTQMRHMNAQRFDKPFQQGAIKIAFNLRIKSLNRQLVQILALISHLKMS